MNSPKKERINYILSLFRKPHVIIAIFFVIYNNRNKVIKKIRTALLGRFNNIYSSYKIYPTYLEKNDTRKIVDKEECNKNYFDISLETISQRGNHPYINDKLFSPIKLASRKYFFTKNIEWEKKFKDTEDYESLHRWNWLLLKLTEARDYSMLKEWGKYHICDWITKYINKIDNSLKWNTYTTGERICNLIIFMEKTSLKCNETVKSALSRMALHMMDNLEYYGTKDTFNHIINNARALYFYGRHFNSPDYARSAIKIIENELPRLVSPDGFLREGSSHYHFLFTRWIMEILYIALKFEDYDTISLVTPYAKNLIKKCWFFLLFDKRKSKWSIPLFGDVSPDFTPEWLMTVPQSHLALSLYNPTGKAPILQRNGWSSLFENSKNEFFNPGECHDNEVTSIKAYSLSGWYRFNFKGTTLFLHVEPSGIPKYQGHFHSDVCSFCLYREGSPVLIDAGRTHYIKDDIGRYGLSARSHNSVQIDGLDPYPDRRYFDVWESIWRRPSVSWSQEEISFQVEIKHFGFSRIYNDRIEHTRKFRIFFSQIIIEDHFSGINKHFIETFFHWAEGLRVEPTDINGQIRVTGGNEKYTIKCKLPENTYIEKEFGNLEIAAGWCFPEYGVKIPIWTLIYKAKTKLPIKQCYTIKWS